MPAKHYEPTPVERYYLMQRYATLILWDAFNPEPPSKHFVSLPLKNASSHYHIYNRGCCLVATPADLFSGERTLWDALQTAKAMAGEVYHKHPWEAVELTGFNQMIRAAWVEIQLLGQKHGKPLTILHYEPTAADRKLCQLQEQAQPGLGKTL